MKREYLSLPLYLAHAGFENIILADHDRRDKNQLFEMNAERMRMMVRA
jgi:hypothetical protein